MSGPVKAEQLFEEGLIKGRINQGHGLNNVLKQVKRIKELPADERDYLYLYLLLENYAVSSGLGYTEETIRNIIKAKFNTKWFPLKLRALFDFKNADQLVYVQILIENIIKRLTKKLSYSVIQERINRVIQGILVSKDKIDFTLLERLLYHKPKQISHVVSSMCKLLVELY